MEARNKRKPSDLILSPRQEANAIVSWAFRNGPLETLHSGKHSPLLENPELSRISNAEMKELMIDSCKKMAKILRLRDESSPEYEKQIMFFHESYTKNWAKK